MKSVKNTTESYIAGKKSTPARIELRGDKTRKPESSTHIIQFPGGALELSRTSDGDYWAHIIVNRDFADNDNDGLHQFFGQVVKSRIDYEYPHDAIEAIPKCEAIRQVAILIRKASTKQT